MDAAFPGWPAEFQGRALREEPLEPRETRVLASFPGKVARFTDGSAQIILRWVTEPTRKLHPAADCFIALGYRVQPQPLWRNEQGELWSVFLASRGSENLRVAERIHDGTGASWSDPSAWWWAAQCRRTTGPWWALTVVRRVPE